MIRMNVDPYALETGVGLEKYVQQIFWYQIFYKDSVGKDLRELKFLKDLYTSKNGSTIRTGTKNRKIECYFNLAKPLIDTATRTFLGRVPDIVSKNEKQKDNIGRFNNYLKHSEFEEEIYDVAKQDSNVGSGFLSLYADIGDTFPRFRSLDPLYTNVVYDCSIAMKRQFAYTIYWDITLMGGAYVCIIYTKDKMYAYYTQQVNVPTSMVFGVYPYKLFQLASAELTYTAYHGFNDIPIYEFMNNKTCSSDIAQVIAQIGLYSALQNNRFKNVDDIMNYLLFIKNARLGDEKEAQKAIDLIKNHRVIPLEGEDVDAKFLSNPLNQTDIQKLADDIKNSIHYTTGIPDFTSVEFTQNASDVIIKAKTKPLLDLCQEKEKWFNRSYFPMLETILEFVERNDPKLYSKIKFDVADTDLVYTHTLPSNETDAVNRIVNLKNAGVLDPYTALQWLPSIPNVDEYIKGAKAYNEYVDNREKEKQNKNNGVNETNIERQNQYPKTKDRQDNIANAIKGDGQDIG